MSNINRLIQQAQTNYKQAAGADDPKLRKAGEQVEEVTGDLISLLSFASRNKQYNQRIERPIAERQGYVIDPLRATAQLTDAPAGSTQAKVEEMAAQVYLMQQLLADRRIRAYNEGPAANATRREQLGVAPDLALQLPQDVVYKRQLKTGAPGAPATQVEFATFRDTPMLDWDVADPSHPGEAVTVDNLGDVEELVRAYQKDNPHSNMRIYQTPGGFRAFEMGHNPGVADYQSAYRQMNVDPLYASLGMRGIRVGEVFDKPGFRSRLSHKPGRVDWVAQPIATLRGSDPRRSVRSERIIKAMHDSPIRQAYLNDPELRMAALSAVQDALPSASQDLRNQIRANLGLS